MAKRAAKTLHKPLKSQRLLDYLKRQPASHISLQDVRTSLSCIGVSLSKRISAERERR